MCIFALIVDKLPPIGISAGCYSCFRCVGARRCCFPGLFMNRHTCKVLLQSVFYHKCLYSNHQSRSSLSGPPLPFLGGWMPVPLGLESLASLRGSELAGEPQVSFCSLKGTLCSCFSVERVGSGGGVMVARVHNSVSCFARCKKTCLFARNSQKYWQTSARVPFLSSWLWRAWGYPASCFQVRGRLDPLLVSPCSLGSSSNIKG